MRSARRRVLGVAGIGIISGIAGSAFIAVLNSALHADNRLHLLLPFCVIVLARVATNLYAQLVVVDFTQDSLMDLSEALSRRIIATPYRMLERIGPARIMATLTDDVLMLAGALLAVPSAITNIAVILGCAAYLAYLSWQSAVALLLFAFIGAVSYHFLLRRSYEAFVRARHERDTLFSHYRGLTDGIKELQMNSGRRRAIIDDIVASGLRSRALNISARRIAMVGDGWAQFMFFSVIGIMLFLMPAIEEVSTESLTGYAVVALYVMSPLWALIGALPSFQRGQAAYDRIDQLGLTLGETTAVTAPLPPREPGETALEFRGVTFSYHDPDAGPHSFELGPIDLTIERGELLFIIGGNGSGKSTFVKLLTGLYTPDAGDILLDGAVLDAAHREAYREQFATVFSDFYLFNRLAAADASHVDDHARSYLGLLDLAQKVTVTDGVLSTTTLSQGQRRRLALLSAYLEDRQFYVFDEWAADQDPTYRQIFYAKLLPELKARGKTVIVITHDDRYVHLGDRVVKLDFGRVADVWRAGSGPLDTEEREVVTPT